MSTPPPPPQGGPWPSEPPPFQPPGYAAPPPPSSYGGPPPPPGYRQYAQPQYGYGMEPVTTKPNGLSIASFVLSLVSVVPCFWALPITAVLGVIFGFVARGQLRRNPGQRGRGLGTAGIVIGFVFIAVAIAVWLWLTTSGHCYRDGSTFRCDDINR